MKAPRSPRSSISARSTWSQATTHLLFIAGVIFFLYRLKDVALYVTLFALGHSVTLLLGVLADVLANPYLIDAVIGVSVVYKALDNLDAFRMWFGVEPNAKAAVLLFGFFHGFGLATKLQELELARDGLIANLISFNVGVEIGQLAALGVILIVMDAWRSTSAFARQAWTANVALLSAPFTGRHGWYWRNLSDEPASITLAASGYYTRLGRIEASAAAVN